MDIWAFLINAWSCAKDYKIESGIFQSLSSYSSIRRVLTCSPLRWQVESAKLGRHRFSIPCSNQGALKVTELWWQRAPKTQIFAENRRFSQIHPFSWKFQHLEGAGNCRKPQIFAENRRFSQKTAGNRRLGSVTLGPSPLARPYCLKTLVLSVPLERDWRYCFERRPL